MNERTQIVLDEAAGVHVALYVSPLGTGRNVFFSPHENEHVVNDHLVKKLERYPGRYLVLKQRGERHLFFQEGEYTFEVDPNRIFTASGTMSSLLRLNPGHSPSSPELLRAYSRSIRVGKRIIALMELGEKQRIVAVHNNTAGYDDDGSGGVGTISIQRYKQKLADGAGYLMDVFVGKGDEDDLFFLTDPSDFAILKRAKWNLALQHPRVATDPDEDDGSLSVWAEMNGLGYINIEAQRRHDDGTGKDHLKVQKAMVDQIFKLP